MSAGISLMYRLSGGCRIGSACSGCRYLAKSESVTGFGKACGMSAEYRCRKHPESESHYWKDSYMACKYFRKATAVTVKEEDPKPKVRRKKTKKEVIACRVTEEQSGQYTFA